MSEDEILDAKECWNNWRSRQKHFTSESDIQFVYNVFVATVAIDVFFSRRSLYWTSEMARMQFDRPEWSVQLENEYFNDFEVQPVRVDGQIVGYQGKPHKTSGEIETYR